MASTLPCSNPTPPTHTLHPPQQQAASLHALAKVLRGERMDPSTPSWQPPAAYAGGGGGGSDEGAMDVAAEGGAPEATGGEGQGAPVVSQAERCVCRREQGGPCWGCLYVCIYVYLYLYLYLYLYSTSCPPATSIHLYLPTKSPTTR